MLDYDRQIQEISTEEYFFLTENFSFADSNTIKERVGYLVYNKRKKLLDTVKLVMENELSEDERNIAIKYWFEKVPAAVLADKYNVSRARIYRILDIAREKLEVSLKYVLVYNDAIKPPSTKELLLQIKGGFFYGEKFEN